MSGIKEISDLVKRVYSGKAWHGPSVTEVLKGVDDTIAKKKVGNSHSIVQLVLHMVSWRAFVIKRLRGDATYELTEADNFPDETDWASAFQKLEQSQTELINAMDAASNALVNEPVANRKYDFFVLLHGIIHHDIYHIGQIQLIKKYSR
jgi:uncharacterized damage-inducible protein DinB